MVRTDRGDFILDNKQTIVLPWSQTEYRFVKRESDDGRFASPSRNNSPRRDPACSSSFVCRPVKDGWHALAGPGSGPAV